MTAPACDEQQTRTERARALVLGGEIRFSPASAPGAWFAVNGDGKQYTVTDEGCTCLDYTERCQKRGWRCKHMEALRLHRKENDMTDTLKEIIEKLEAPFSAAAIQWKPQKVYKDKGRAQMVAYIDARNVMERLDEAVGPFNWQSRHEPAGNGLITHIGIRNPETGEWIWKSDLGFVDGSDGDEEKSKSAKGSASDGIKRAAVQWGIGRYLYKLERFYVDYDVQAKKAKSLPVLPDWALPVDERQKFSGKKAASPPPATEPAASVQVPASAPARFYSDGAAVNGNKDEQEAFDRYVASLQKPPPSLEGLRTWVRKHPAAAKAQSN